ncbi:beta-1,4-galactosyltransferase 3-like [Candoia aspera]|uniref:beta-1,4-galactosyltransferase 3-like n=1 Tax=Candoia aspera TaxID=51853 RepID=UPI002FD7DA2E
MKKMNLSRTENPCFLLLLVIFQVIFILILYRGSSSVLFQGYLEVPKSLDYSKSKDVYINLSLFTPAPDKATMQTCTPQSDIIVGFLSITFDTLHSERTIIRKNPYVRSGGCYSPPHCLARYKTAIIVPCRNCEKQLHHFLYYLHPFLQRQQLSYCIYLIHQAGSGPFNRAKLLNVGVREALKDNDWDCLLLHNVDLVPENDYNLYVCDEYYPKHLSTAIDKLNYRLPYSSFFGGVTALTPDHYMKINGFPNTYWERLGEDDDIAKRIHIVGMKITRVPFRVGRYKMMDYGQATSPLLNLERPAELRTSQTWKDDGTNSLVFELWEKKKKHLYTYIIVDIGDIPALPSPSKRERNNI